jgi:phosphoglycerol transferase MdoB-like AlkP superfamily enzyme
MVSNLPLLNKISPNSLMALNWAISNYRNSKPYAPVSKAEGRALALAAIGRESLDDKTPHNSWLAKNPPHVVAIVMESFGSNMLEFDRPGSNDLLGSFRRHMDEDFVFWKFLPDENFTMQVCARLLFACPDESITRSLFKSKKLSGTPFEVYKQNGYETVFIHPGHGSWHDSRQYMALHEVDRICFMTDLIEMYKGDNPDIRSEASSWGLPDEYIFPVVQKMLEKSEKPMFIVILTLTNHPPDMPPPTYKDRFPINPDQKALEAIGSNTSAKLKMMRSFQYASNCVGDFIAGIKNSPLGSRTVIGAFGDHKTIRVKKRYPEGLFLYRAVPFYLYVPKPILANTKHRFAPERPGSHKDVMPTLFACSLSGASYYSVGGRNLLAEQDDPARAFGYNVSLFMDEHGACGIGEDFSNAWYSFDQGMLLDAAPKPIPEAAAQKISAYERLYRWQINARTAGVME